MAKHVALIADPGAAVSLAAALSEGGYRISSVEPTSAVFETLARRKPDAAFIALSGVDGGGRVQGLLELLEIPYTQSGVLASALAADRHQAKIMLRAAGLPVTDHLIVDRAEAARAHQLPPPYVVKPISARISAPLIIVRSEREPAPDQLLTADWRGGEAVMIERFVPGRTLAVAVMGDVALSVTEIALEKDSAAPSGTRIQLTTPARISPNIYEKLQKMSLKAHEVLGCRGVTRTTFRFNDQASGDTGIVCLEIDTQPELTPGALVPEQARYAGHSLADLVAWMVEDASCNR